MSIDYTSPNCTMCTWCSHTVGTSTVYHIRIPNLGCVTHPQPWPMPEPPCTCYWDRTVIPWTWVHGDPCPKHP